MNKTKIHEELIQGISMVTCTLNHKFSDCE